MKHYLKLNKKILKFDELKIEIKKAISKVKQDNYGNYFLYAYDPSNLKSQKSSSKRCQKKYKD